MGGITAAEQAKYEKMWAVENYADFSPGERLADLFMEVSGAKPNSLVVDLGAGSGKGSVALTARGLWPVMIDLTPDGLTEAAKGIPFVRGNLWGDWAYEVIQMWPRDRETDPVYGYCCDVMEHIPIEFTMCVARLALELCDGGVFFSISFIEDGFGKAINETLHLTVKPFVWWRDRLRELGEVTDARDMLGQGTFFVRRR